MWAGSGIFRRVYIIPVWIIIPKWSHKMIFLSQYEKVFLSLCRGDVQLAYGLLCLHVCQSDFS